MSSSRLGPRRLLNWFWRELRLPLLRNALFIMAVPVVGSVLGILFLAIATRAFAEEDVGYAVTLFQTVTFLSTLAHLGLGTATIRYLPETEEKTPLVNTCLTLVGIAAIVLSVVFIVGIGLWAPALGFILENPAYPFVIVVAALSLALPAIVDQAGYAMRRADLLLWRTALMSFLKIPLIFAFSFVTFTRRLGIFASLTIASAVAIVVEAFFLLPRVLPGYRPRPHLGFHRIRPMIRFSLGNYAANSIAAAGTLPLTLLILNVLGTSGPINAAYFYVANVVAALPIVIPTATFTSFFAEASQRNAERHRDERKTFWVTLGLLAAVITAVFVFAQPLLDILGSRTYAAGAIGSLRILVFAALPAFLNIFYTTRIKIRKRTAPLVVGATILCAVTLGAGYLFLSWWGIDGLSVAFVLGQAAPVPYYAAIARESFRAETAGTAA